MEPPCLQVFGDCGLSVVQFRGVETKKDLFRDRRIAYAAQTSGSTGRRKMVLVSRDSIAADIREGVSS